MKHLMWYCCFFLLVAVGCKKDDESATAGDQYADKLTIGGGMSGFNITAETSTFTRVGGNASLYWRLECKDDYGNQGAKLQIDKNVGGTYTAYRTITPPVLQDYGHIYVNGPVSIDAAGTYRATGTHIASGRVVATKEFTVN
jgi:hypothetical protein